MIEIQYPCRVEINETDRAIFLRDKDDKILLFEKIGFHSGYRLKLLDQMAIEDESWVASKELYNRICSALNAVQGVRELCKKRIGEKPNGYYDGDNHEDYWDEGFAYGCAGMAEEVKTILDGREK